MFPKTRVDEKLAELARTLEAWMRKERLLDRAHSITLEMHVVRPLWEKPTRRWIGVTDPASSDECLSVLIRVLKLITEDTKVGETSELILRALVDNDNEPTTIGGGEYINMGQLNAFLSNHEIPYQVRSLGQWMNRWKNPTPPQIRMFRKSDLRSGK